MAKLTLTDPATLIGLTTVIANNNAAIEAALENTLSRDGTVPNEMNTDLDMNGNKIFNLPEATTASEPVRKQEFDEGIAANFPLPDNFYATNSDAEAGTSEVLVMTPATVKHVNDIQTAALTNYVDGEIADVYTDSVAAAAAAVTARIADDAETIAGTDPLLLVSPAGLAAAFDVEGQEIIDTVLQSLPDTSQGYTEPTIEDKTYALIDADGYIIADHGPGDGVQFDEGVGIDAYENARRRLNPNFMSSTLLGDKDGVIARYSKVGLSEEGYVLWSEDELGALDLTSASGLKGPPIIGHRSYLDDTVFYAGSDSANVASMHAYKNGVMDCYWMFGQSYVVGAAGATPEVPAYSLTPRDPGYAFMPAEGLVRNFTTATRLGSSGIADLRSIEVYNDTPARIVGETIAPECAHQILAAQQAAMGFKTPQFWHGINRGGWPWNVLGTPGSPQRKNLLFQAEWNMRNIRAAGYRANPRAIVIQHGEEDYNTDPDILYRLYHHSLTSFRQELANMHGVPVSQIKVILSAPMRGPFNTAGKVYVASPTQAFLKMEDYHPDIYSVAGANYQVPHLAAHPTMEGTRHLAGMYARAILGHVLGCGNYLSMRIMGDPIRIAADTVRVMIRVPHGGALLAEPMDTGFIGNPSDDTLANYIGPNMPTTGVQRFGGIWDTDESYNLSSGIGVIDASIGSSVSMSTGWARYPLDITFAANYEPGRTLLHFGAFSQSGSNGGTEEDGPRTIFYGSVGHTIEDGTMTCYPRLIPETKRCVT